MILLSSSDFENLCVFTFGIATFLVEVARELSKGEGVGFGECAAYDEEKDVEEFEFEFGEDEDDNEGECDGVVVLNVWFAVLLSTEGEISICVCGVCDE